MRRTGTVRKNRRVRIKEKKPIPKIVLWAMFFCLLFATYELALRFAEPRLLPINHIKLDAEFNLASCAQVKNEIGKNIKGFFSTDVMRLRDKLLTIPFVEEVLIKRIWPDTLWVKVMEQKLVANFGDHAALSSTGKIIDNVQIDLDPNLPSFIGSQEQAAMMLEQFTEMSNILKPLDVSIRELALNSRRSWQITLSNGMKIIMGRKEVSDKLGALTAIFPKLQHRHGDNIDSIDLRYPNGICVHTK